MTGTQGMPPTFPAPGPQPMGWATPPTPPAPRRRASITSVIAIVVSCAALGVGIASLHRPAQQVAAPTPASTSTPGRPANSTEANHAFCTAIAPLLSESKKTAQSFMRVDKNAADWSGAAQSFIGSTKDWVSRMQPVIDSHEDADPFLQRSMQRFVDDMQYLVDDMQAGDGPAWLPYDQTTWNDSLAALSGPTRNCFDLGVKW